nr:hypothetical protein CFP56_22846 [Quercus suber]
MNVQWSVVAYFETGIEFMGWEREEISNSNHPQRISCNKKAKSICRTRRRNLITRKSLVSSLLQVVDGIDLVHKFKENY